MLAMAPLLALAMSHEHLDYEGLAKEHAVMRITALGVRWFDTAQYES
jgi:hypothetical protein